MPILIVSYILNYLDRTNVSFAALTMNEAIGLTAAQFGLGSGIFFLGYCLLEVPSNLALYRFGARRWISRIMISWGLVSAAMALAVGPTSFYVLRALLGAAEAGFFPGVAFYLATWFPAEYRTRIIAWFMVAIPISSVIGGPVSGLLLRMDGVAGLAGWQWLFLVEGLPVVVVGLVLLWMLADTPENTAWLSDEEKAIVRRRLESERRPKEVRRLSVAIRDPRVLTLASIQFGFLVGSYGIGLFLPQILDTGRLTDVQIGFVTSALLRRGQRRHDCLGGLRGSRREQGRQPRAGVRVVGVRVSRRDPVPGSVLGVGLLDGRGGHRHQRRARHLLDDSTAVPDRHGRRRRPGVHQLDRDRWRIRGPIPLRVAERGDGIVHGLPHGDVRLPVAASLMALSLRRLAPGE